MFATNANTTEEIFQTQKGVLGSSNLTDDKATSRESILLTWHHISDQNRDMFDTLQNPWNHNNPQLRQNTNSRRPDKDIALPPLYLNEEHCNLGMLQRQVQDYHSAVSRESRRRPIEDEPIRAAEPNYTKSKCKVRPSYAAPSSWVWYRSIVIEQGRKVKLQDTISWFLGERWEAEDVYHAREPGP